MMMLRTTFGPNPRVKVRIPSSRPILTRASNACAYPNLCAGGRAPSAHIRTRATCAGCQRYANPQSSLDNQPQWGFPRDQPGHLLLLRMQFLLDWTVVVVLFFVGLRLQSDCTARTLQSSTSTVAASKRIYPTKVMQYLSRMSLRSLREGTRQGYHHDLRIGTSFSTCSVWTT